jgi:hypothetical protein
VCDVFFFVTVFYFPEMNFWKHVLQAYYLLITVMHPTDCTRVTWSIHVHLHAVCNTYTFPHTHDVQLHGRTWKSSLYMRMTLQWPFSRRPQTAGHLRPKAWMGMSVPTALRRMRAIFKNLYREICKPGPCVAIQWFHAKCVIGFSLFSRDPDGWSISNFYRFVSLCIWWLTLSAYTASNCFVSKNQTCTRPLRPVSGAENFQSFITKNLTCNKPFISTDLHSIAAYFISNEKVVAPYGNFYV